MGNTISVFKRYYGTINTVGWNQFQNSWLTKKKIENVVKHKSLGYCVKLYEQEIEDVKKKMTIDLLVWPDNDSYNKIETFKLNGIYVETEIIEEV